jgi:heme A synthase
VSVKVETKTSALKSSLPALARFAWSVLGYNLLVILWGAYVRATGSGAGCGAHWPSCDGQVIPRSLQNELAVEFVHRVTSGLTLVLIVALAAWALRAYPRGSRVRFGALATLGFTILEALVGAGLVLFGLTADNDSVARAVVISIHQVNTLMLLAFLALTAWWSSGGQPVRLRGQGTAALLLGLVYLAFITVGMSGAITALGDTLFPSTTLREGLAQDTAAGAHFLLRLRVIHPILAVGTAVLAIGVALWLRRARPNAGVRWLAPRAALLLGLQVALGAVNVLLLAPLWMQMVHLLVTDLIWISLVLLGASALVEQPA